MNMDFVLNHEYFMRLALQEAVTAYEIGEVPIGAVVVSNGLVIGRGHNQTEKLKDISAHAELLAITAAANYLDTKYLPNCIVYVTIEPCVMCAGALSWSQIGGLVYGASEPRTGFSLYKPSLLHPKTKVISEVLKTECIELMQRFFRDKRQ
jgi:tRNA(adenine34) deaminase